jgi:YD repeat-containing protein
MSDREEHGLRGSVRICVEENTYPGATAADGTQIPGWTSRHTSEYSVEGRVIATRSRNSDSSEWVNLYTYDTSGNLLKITTGNEGETTTETVYSYDNLGRLLNITNESRPTNPITFRYDQYGRKTKVETSRPEDYRANMAFAGSPFQITDRAPNLPGGGSATTVYDEHDRPTEVQVRDAQGELAGRAVRMYDTQGRVSEEHQILDNPETIFPLETRAEILKSSGVSLNELREEITRVLGGQPGPFSIVHSYDAQGRISQMRRRTFSQEDVIETTYNEHGDKEAEIMRSKQIGNGKEGSPPGGGLHPYSEVCCAYQYDHHGNWIEELASYRSSPDGAFQSSTRRVRNLTYY